MTFVGGRSLVIKSPSLVRNCSRLSTRVDRIVMRFDPSYLGKSVGSPSFIELFFSQNPCFSSLRALIARAKLSSVTPVINCFELRIAAVAIVLLTNFWLARIYLIMALILSSS